MKTSKKYAIAVFVLAFTVAFLSWNYSPKSGKEIKIPLNSFFYDKDLHGVSEAALSAFMADHEWDFSPAANSKYPAAEDVLVQRIPGDKGHLLVMAFYSKENFSEPFVTLDHAGAEMILRDDGKGDDQKAGDGLYTTKINVNVNDFRKQVLSMATEMKQSGRKPYRFINRSMVSDPDAAETFDQKKFDNNEAVSISGLTSGVGNDLIDSINRNCVFITDLKVVEDPTRTWNSCAQSGNVNGPWTFGTLMRNLASSDPQHIASDAQLSTFLKTWLNKWQNEQIINSDTVKARTAVKTKILNPWLSKSKQAGAPQGQLDMRFAPFKLMAIATRFDLRERGFTLGAIPAGEIRFIFCLINSDCTDKEDFTVIFEFGAPVKKDCDSIRAWGQKIVNLKNFTIGSAAYNLALQSLTDKVSLCGSNPKQPNQSSLDALRTNDRALSPSPIISEFRQFALNSSGKLGETVISLCPMDKYNAQVDNDDVRRMVGWINANRGAIKKDNYTLPNFLIDSITHDTIPFQAGKTQILGTPVDNSPNAYHWDGIEQRKTASFIRNTAARHTFSLNICSGCHAGETQTFFFHVTPVFFGTQTSLSGFLTGNPQPEAANFDVDGNHTNDSMMIQDAAFRPATGPLVYFFNDNLRRARDLKDIVSTPCNSVFSLRDDLMFSSVPVH